jgi:hypothetical protein
MTEMTEKRAPLKMPTSLYASLRLNLAERTGPCTLVALIELGKLDDALRQRFLDGHSPRSRVVPMIQKAEFAEIAPYGPVLHFHQDGPQALLDEMGGYDSDTVSAWIVSVLPPEELAKHLGHFLFAWPQKNHNLEYIVRYYEPATLPTLHKLAAKHWVRGLFEPVFNWWYPVVTATGAYWTYIEGEGKAPNPILVDATRHLPLTEEIWEALESDVLPYKITNVLQEQMPGLFKADCYGVRVAQVEEQIVAGREKGLRDDNDLLMYVWHLLEQPNIHTDPRWNEAVARAARSEAALITWVIEPQNPQEPLS